MINLSLCLTARIMYFLWNSTKLAFVSDLDVKKKIFGAFSPFLTESLFHLNKTYWKFPEQSVYGNNLFQAFRKRILLDDVFLTHILRSMSAILKYGTALLRIFEIWFSSYFHILLFPLFKKRISCKELEIYHEIDTLFLL